MNIPFFTGLRMNTPNILLSNAGTKSVTFETLLNWTVPDWHHLLLQQVLMVRTPLSHHRCVSVSRFLVLQHPQEAEVQSHGHLCSHPPLPE